MNQFYKQFKVKTSFLWVLWFVAIGQKTLFCMRTKVN